MNLKRKLSLLLLCLLGAAYHGCNTNSLEQKPFGATEDSFFESDADFNRAAIGLYSKLLFYYQIPRNYVYANVNLIADDDVTSQVPVNNDRLQFNSTSRGLFDAFQTTYELITRANMLFEKLEEKGGKIKSEKLRNYVTGEARFLRAYANFLAWNWWETAPLVERRLTDVTALNIPNSSGMQLLDQAIADLRQAETLLPPKGGWGDAGVGTDAANLGRATQGAAKALLGKVLLYKACATKASADYAAAAAKLAEVTGYSLVNAYGDNFKPTTENNAESVFEIQFGSSANPQNNGWLSTDEFAVVGTLAAFRNFTTVDPNPSDGAANYFPTRPLIETFNAADPRLPWTIFRVGDVIGSNNRRYSTANASASPTGAHFSKYQKEFGWLYASYNNPSVDFNNERVIRYADVLLMRAEALNESGGSTAEVIGLLNQVRKRARESVSPAAAEPADLSASEASRDVIAEWIRRERRMELALEGHRYFDLLRWHRAGKIDLTTWNWGVPGVTVTWAPNNIRLPLPQRELDNNNALEQNEGY
ncbi:MAG: RagB/SusD family nutrient uptake outer membrane protein [Cytophagales bacterium]|jgi:hypothetical protein|nr:RagB/SusD family nutrient uptake outer membrane protein [Cytophagales bacterium]